MTNLNHALGGKINLFDPSKKINAAILGSNEPEPIYQLLIKNNSAELNCNFPLIISNHDKLNYISKQFDIDYIKINNDDDLLNALKKNNIDLVILARYMQIIPNNIISNVIFVIILMIYNVFHINLPMIQTPTKIKNQTQKK